MACASAAMRTMQAYKHYGGRTLISTLTCLMDRRRADRLELQLGGQALTVRATSSKREGTRTSQGMQTRR